MSAFEKLRSGRRTVWLNVLLLGAAILIWAQAFVRISDSLPGSEIQAPGGWETFLAEGSTPGLGPERLGFRYKASFRNPFQEAAAKTVVDRSRPMAAVSKSSLPPVVTIQGIIYETPSPMAIITGRTGQSQFVSTGDTLEDYVIKHIGQDTVVFLASDSAQYTFGISH